MGGTRIARVAIITGAERNIGAAVAIRLAAARIAVAVNYRGEQTRASAEAVAVPGDVAREDDGMSRNASCLTSQCLGPTIALCCRL